MATAFNSPSGFSVSSVPVIDSNGNFISGSVSDLLSARLNSEVSLTGSSSATISVWNRVNSLSGNATITLPAASTNSGKFVGIIIDQNCGNNLVTLQDPNGAYIDYDMLNGVQTGRATRIMWADEVAILYSNGTYWHKVDGKTVPMSVSLTTTGNQTFSAGAATLIAMTTVVYSRAPSSFFTAATPVVTIRRPGLYCIEHHLGFNNTNSGATNTVTYIYKNGASAEGAVGYNPIATAFLGQLVKHTNVFAAGDTLQPYGKYGSGSFTTTVISIGISGVSFTVTEIPIW